MKRRKLAKLPISKVIDGWKLHDGRTLLIIKHKGRWHEFAYNASEPPDNACYGTEVKMEG